MKLIIKNRGGGKTYDLIKISASTGIPIVSPHPEYVNEMARSLGIDIPALLSPLGLMRYNGSGREVYIDELDAVFQMLFGVGISAATITPETIQMEISPCLSVH